MLSSPNSTSNHRMVPARRRFLRSAEIRQNIAVVKAELTMVKWIVSGVGFGMLLLLIRSFWPT